MDETPQHGQVVVLRAGGSVTAGRALPCGRRAITAQIAAITMYFSSA